MKLFGVLESSCIIEPPESDATAGRRAFLSAVWITIAASSYALHPLSLKRRQSTNDWSAEYLADYYMQTSPLTVRAYLHTFVTVWECRYTFEEMQEGGFK